MTSKPRSDHKTKTPLPASLAASKLLTTEQAAEYLGDVSKRTLEDWRRKGTGPDYVTLSPTMVRYRRGAIDRWVETRECKLSSNEAA